MNIQEVADNARRFLGDGFLVDVISDVFVTCARSKKILYIFPNIGFIEVSSQELMGISEGLARHLNERGGKYEARRRYY